MSKFNKTTETERKTVNHMGADALKVNPKMELVGILLTSFGENDYYRKQGDTIKRLKELVKQVDKDFVAKAAIYARTVFGMRSVTHVIASELAKYVGGETWAKDFYNIIIYRPDDMTEIVSYYNQFCANESKNSKRGKKTITNAMKQGFSKALGRFNEYELAKYKGENKTTKLVDIVNMVHPSNESNKQVIVNLVEGNLKSSGTWESELTKAGQDAKNEEEKGKLKKEAWAKLIKEKKIGIFALLRNLRNIYEQSPDMIPEALEILTDAKRIKKSLILPFRFLTAYEEIEKLESKKVFEKDAVDNVKILEAIEKAILISIENLPILEGKTVILSDNSGSMRGDDGGSSLTSRLSDTKTSDIANLFALMYWMKSDNTLMGLFGDRLIHPAVDRAKGLFENFKIVDKTGKSCGQGTERGIFEMFVRLVKEKIIANTIVIFSDCQIGSGCSWYDNAGNRGHNFMQLFSEYKKINPNFRCYSVNLKEYGTTVFDGSVIKISGWSEKIFDIMKFAEQDKNALINEIEKISFEEKYEQKQETVTQ